GPITLLRGFKVPIVVLDRFLTAHGAQETERCPPLLFGASQFQGRGFTSDSPPILGPQSAFFRARLAASHPDLDPASLEAVRLLIPYLQRRSAYGYVADAFVMVHTQRHVQLAAELPEQAPPGFAALRREVLGFAAECEQALLQAAGMHDPGAESAFFCCVYRGLRSDLRCGQCAAEFETFSALAVHESELHDVDIRRRPLPDGL
ncbi:hypothetical protein N658DRAFT_431990, partial [Parathielavia hyrcaniae]